MRVLYIITGLSVGGAETMLVKLLECMDRARYQPVVISLTTLGELGPRISTLDVPVHALGMTGGLASPISFLRLVWQIRRLKVDIVHTWLYHADLVGGLAARLAGVTNICWGIRSSNLDRDKTRWTTRAVRRICAQLSGVIPKHIFINSEVASALHIELGYAADKIEVIPNGFDLSRFKPDQGARLRLRSDLGCTEDALFVGMVGRFDPLKNHRGFFLAMSLVHKHMPQVQLVLAGKGIDCRNEELVGFVKDAELEECTHLLGPHDNVSELMAALDVLVCPSHAEAFPNVLGEAMAAGVPSVATDVGDCAYVIGDTGRVVSTGDIDGLASGVSELLLFSSAQRSSLGDRARARIASHFEIKNVVRRYEDAYKLLRRELDEL